MVPSILRCIPPPREEASRLEPDDGGRPPWPGICGSLRLGEPFGVAVAERELPRGYIEPPLGGNWPLLLEDKFHSQYKISFKVVHTSF